MKKENFSKIFFFLLIFPSFSFTGVRIQTDCRVMCRGVDREGPSGGMGPQVLKQSRQKSAVLTNAQSRFANCPPIFDYLWSPWLCECVLSCVNPPSFWFDQTRMPVTDILTRLYSLEDANLAKTSFLGICFSGESWEMKECAEEFIISRILLISLKWKIWNAVH